ncbi:MAG TPA: M1 family metallopeptidase [Bacteroidota bacterium]|nr:M1 family metallopeptidase [Bacteroidota bacterium]
MCIEKKYFWLPVLFFITPLIAQEHSSYDPRETFDPLFDANGGSLYRSADGTPGPGYWQNKADYKIHARLNEGDASITADEVIAYTNNSPNNLDYVWLYLDQNRFRNDSRSRALSGPNLSGTEEFNGGFDIKDVSISEGGKLQPAHYLITDTRMQIRLAAALKSKGGKIQIHIRYSFKIAPQGLGRSGWMNSKNGLVYDIAQWYPRMAVYDDIKGWNTLPFLGSGEFYLDYGDYDFSVDVPWDQIVAASGELVNPGEVLTKTEIGRLNKARKSNRTVYIISPSEIGKGEARPTAEGRDVWHYIIHNARDVSWASSRAFIWDAAKVNLPSSKPCLAHSVYPIESDGDTAWGRATEYLKNSVEIFSKHWFEYPYPNAVTVGGPVGGMEYPAIVFCWYKSTRKELWMVINHEIGHNWFPMIVGSNEREDAWMDEGFNTFIDILSFEDFNHGEYAPKRDGEYAPNGGNPAREVVPYLSDTLPPILTYADNIPGKYVHPLEYFKTSFGLVLLRNYIVGPERFDYAFRNYIKNWAFKHPGPFDFFRCMNNAAGENLNWFWKGWFVKNWKLDQAVTNVAYVDNDPSKGSLITIQNNDKMVMPVTVEVKESNGKSGRVNLPVEIWLSHKTWKFKYHSTSAIDSVIVDPDFQLPDVDLSNNVWSKQQ